MSAVECVKAAAPEELGAPLVRTESSEMNRLYGEGDNDSVHSSSSGSFEEVANPRCRMMLTADGDVCGDVGADSDPDDLEDELDLEEEQGLTECIRSSHDSNSSDQFLNEEDPSGSEQSHESSADHHERATSRYFGHPLGVEELEDQEYSVHQHKMQLAEEFMVEFQHKNKWSLSESRARAKILVAEGYAKEKGHLMAQMTHVLEHEVLGQEPRPCRRFRYDHRYRCAGFNTHGDDALKCPATMRRTVAQRMSALQDKWGSIMHAVDLEMAHDDNFPNVIKNLSTMRIFLEGQQNTSYCPDINERARRCQQYQAVIENVMCGDNGLFLRDALPHAPPLDYCRNPNY